MPGIFNDARRGRGADCARSQRDGANFRQGRVADGSWGAHPTAPPAPNPGGNSLPPKRIDNSVPDPYCKIPSSFAFS